MSDLKPTTIIPLSGGLDSTAAAWQTLIGAPNQHHLLLHVNLLNEESRHRALVEQYCSEQIVAYFKQAGLNNFEFKQATLEYVEAGFPPIWDIEGLNFIAGIFVRGNENIRQFVKGAIAEDFEQDDYPDRLQTSTQIFYQISERSADNFSFDFPLKNMRKAQVYNSLPIELRRLTWSCRTPIFEHGTFKPCKQCHTCKELQNAGIPFNADFKF